MVDKYILVTGSSSGIGEALCRIYSESGYQVVGVSRREGGDVGKEDTWLKLTQKYPQVFSMMFLNAGVAWWEEGEEYRHREELVRTNLLGVYYGLHYADKLLRVGGLVVVTSSVAAYRPQPDTPLYDATKAAVSSMIKSFALKFDGNYRVIGIAPGFVNTRLGGQEEVPEHLIEQVPLRRAMIPEELAVYIKKITEIGYLNGVDVVIDGGLVNK